MTIEQNLNEGNERRKDIVNPTFQEMVKNRLDRWRLYDECITIYHPEEARTEAEEAADFYHSMNETSRFKINTKSQGYHSIY